MAHASLTGKICLVTGATLTADGLERTLGARVVKGVTGKYFFRRRAVRPNRMALDEAACRRLWEASEALVARSAP